MSNGIKRMARKMSIGISIFSRNTGRLLASYFSGGHTVRFVKSAEDIERIQGIYSRSHELGVRALTVHFETDPEAVAALLPPQLEPSPSPVGVAWVREVGNSTTVGPYSVGGVAIRAKYREITAYYVLAQPVSTSAALTFGRDLYGEPSKLAKVVFEEQDEHVWGSAERHEIRYLSVRGRCDEEAPAGREENGFFYFKYLLRPDGSGFDTPPVLIHTIEDIGVKSARRGRGEVVFRDSPHDPISDIPVRQVVEAVYTEGHLYRSARVLTLADPEAFLPYAFLKSDDLGSFAEATVLHAQATRRTTDGKGNWRKTA
jgi:acetoacetate decarboxylase